MRDYEPGLYVAGWQHSPATRHLLVEGQATLCGRDASWWEREAGLDRIDAAPKVCGSCLRVASSDGRPELEGVGV